MRFLFSILLAFFIIGFNAQALDKIHVLTMVDDQIATGAAASFSFNGVNKTFFAFGSTSAGAGSCSVKIQASNDNVTFIDIATISLVLSTTVTADGFASAATWKYVRGNVSAIAGTNAMCSLLAGATGIN